MESLVIAIVIIIAIVGFLAVFNTPSSMDINSDGKIDSNDAKDALNNTIDAIKSAADLNKDGVVNTDDVEIAAAKVEETVDKVVKKAKTKLKK